MHYTQLLLLHLFKLCFDVDAALVWILARVSSKNTCTFSLLVAWIAILLLGNLSYLFVCITLKYLYLRVEITQMWTDKGDGSGSQLLGGVESQIWESRQVWSGINHIQGGESHTFFFWSTDGTVHFLTVPKFSHLDDLKRQLHTYYIDDSLGRTSQTSPW